MKEEEKINRFEVGKRVRAARDRKGLSGEALGEKIGYSQNVISKIELGKTAKVNLDTIKAIAKTCDVSEDYLLLRSDYFTKEEERKNLIHQIQKDDVMWIEFIRYIAQSAGYTVKEADRKNVPPTDTKSPYIVFEKDGVEDYLNMTDINDFMSEVERHAGLSLQMLIEKRRKRG